jgi:hypothetical protein
MGDQLQQNIVQNGQVQTEQVVPVNPEGEPQFPDENYFFEALLASNNQLGQA